MAHAGKTHIYPSYLNLKPAVEAGRTAPLHTHALDVTIVSRPVVVGGRVLMVATTRLYDKRREAYFLSLPVNVFGHVSSNVADSVHVAVVRSALHRRLVACGDLEFCGRSGLDGS